MDESRAIPGDWSSMAVPEGVDIGEGTYIASAYSFRGYRSRMNAALTIGKQSTINNGCLFDVGPLGQVSVGDFTVLNDVCIMADDRVRIGDYSLVSWEVVILDSYRWPHDAASRRTMLEAIASGDRDGLLTTSAAASRVTIGNNVWIGFGSIIMPGVTIGDGSVIGCKSVVTHDVAAYSVYGGNPSRFIKSIAPTPAKDTMSQRGNVRIGQS